MKIVPEFLLRHDLRLFVFVSTPTIDIEPLLDNKKVGIYEFSRKFPLLAGALGLEPRAYGFGDDADKSASGELSFEVNISTIQKEISATSAKLYQIRNKLGISETSLRFSESTVC